jgi:hypothetical protein
MVSRKHFILCLEFSIDITLLISTMLNLCFMFCFPIMSLSMVGSYYRGHHNLTMEEVRKYVLGIDCLELFLVLHPKLLLLHLHLHMSNIIHKLI